MRRRRCSGYFHRMLRNHCTLHYLACLLAIFSTAISYGSSIPETDQSQIADETFRANFWRGLRELYQEPHGLYMRLERAPAGVGLYRTLFRTQELLGPAETAADECGGKSTCPLSGRGRQALAEGRTGSLGKGESTTAVHDGSWAAQASGQVDESFDGQHEMRQERLLGAATIPWTLDGFFLNKPGAYFVELQLGFNKQRVKLQVDTGSDVLWTRCGCPSCFPHRPSPPAHPPAAHAPNASVPPSRHGNAFSSSMLHFTPRTTTYAVLGAAASASLSAPALVPSPGPSPAPSPASLSPSPSPIGGSLPPSMDQSPSSLAGRGVTAPASASASSPSPDTSEAGSGNGSRNTAGPAPSSGKHTQPPASAPPPPSSTPAPDLAPTSTPIPPASGPSSGAGGGAGGTQAPYPASASLTLQHIPCTQAVCLGFTQDYALETPIGCQVASILRSRDCQFSLTYGDRSAAAGFLLLDLLSLAPSPVAASVVFGCSTAQSGRLASSRFPLHGLLGLGRGPLSIIRQLADGGADWVVQVEQDSSNRSNSSSESSGSGSGSGNSSSSTTTNGTSSTVPKNGGQGQGQGQGQQGEGGMGQAKPNKQQPPPPLPPRPLEPAAAPALAPGAIPPAPPPLPPTPPTPTLPVPLQGQQKLQLRASFSLCLEGQGGGGHLVIGRQPLQDSVPAVVEPLANTPDSTLYRLGVKGVFVGEESVPLPASTTAVSTAADGSVEGGVVVDSGASFTALPAETLLAFVNRVQAAAKQPFFTSHYLHCMRTRRRLTNEDLASSFPAASLVFSSGAIWLVPPYNYLFHTNDTTLCIAAVGYRASSTIYVGDSWLRNNDVLFDQEANTLSFVPMNCTTGHLINTTTSDIIRSSPAIFLQPQKYLKGATSSLHNVGLWMSFIALAYSLVTLALL